MTWLFLIGINSWRTCATQRVVRLGLVLCLVLMGLVAYVPPSARAAAVIVDPVLKQRLETASAFSLVQTIVTYTQLPTSADLASLTALGASITPLKHLPIVTERTPT